MLAHIDAQAKCVEDNDTGESERDGKTRCGKAIGESDCGDE